MAAITVTVNVGLRRQEIKKRRALTDEDRLFIRSILDHYDTDGSGELDHDEVKAFLSELNEGLNVSDGEVAWLIRDADRDRSGSISVTEVMDLVEQWFLMTGDDDLPSEPTQHQELKLAEERMREAQAKEDARVSHLPRVPSAKPGPGESPGPRPSNSQPPSPTPRVAFRVDEKSGPGGGGEDSVGTGTDRGESGVGMHDPHDEEDVTLEQRAAAMGLAREDFEFVHRLMLKYDFSDNGFMEPREVAHLLQDLNGGTHLPKNELTKVFKQFDTDNDGKLNFKEVYQLLHQWYDQQDANAVEEVDYDAIKKCSIM